MRARLWAIHAIAQARARREYERTSRMGRAAMSASIWTYIADSATRAANIIRQIEPRECGTSERATVSEAIESYRQLTNLGRYARKVSRE